MNSRFRVTLTLLTLGVIMFFFGCGKSSTSPKAAAATATDVVLIVPGMYWASGWPTRVRKALATLPWVEQDSIQTDVSTREVHFNLKDKSAFNADAATTALNKQGFKEVTVKTAP